MRLVEWMEDADTFTVLLLGAKQGVTNQRQVS